jgi:lipopolysaccharide export system permease protein
MRLLARYLLRECLIALGFCFSAFLIFWIATDLISNLHILQSRQMRGGDVLLYYFFKIPEFLPIALPVALLLSLLYAITTHARHNEITAIRAAGVSLSRLSLPYFGIGLAATSLLFASNEFVAPDASDRAEEILNRRDKARSGKESRQVKKNLSFTNSRDGRAWHIAVYNKQTEEMIGPAVDWRLPDGSVRSIFADRAVFTNRAWTFIQVRESYRAAGLNSVNVKTQTNSLSFPEFSETPEVIKSEISISDRFGKESRTRSADLPILDIMNYFRLHPNPDRAFKAKLYTKLQGRIAGPATCLAVVLLAVPFAAASGRRNVFVGVAASIVIFFIYYILQQVGLAYAEAGRVPAWFGVWFPNLLVAITGLWMMARVR